MTLKKVPPKRGIPTPLVTIRREAIVFNAPFVTTSGIDRYTHVSVSIDPDLFQVVFKFQNDFTEAFKLTRDGGGRGKGKAIQTAALMHANSWLAAISSKPEHSFKPEQISADSWFISICPSFENRVSDKSDIPSNVRGIYRYKHGNEIVYIGRGQVRSRTHAFGREEWDFETIEYSVLPEEAEQKKWEAFWLDHFVKQYGELPIYNRIAGERSKPKMASK